MEYDRLPANLWRMAALHAFLRLSRLKFLTGGVLGVALGVAMARWSGHAVDWTIVAVVQLTVSALQLMTHFSNEYFDRESDALAVRTPFSGGSGVLTSGALRPRVALIAALIALLVALCALAALAVLGKTLGAGIALAIASVAWAYSSPPFTLHSRGAGEFATALAVGMLVPLFAFAALANTVTPLAVLSALPAAGAMFIMMICVEVPDVTADSVTGKRNLLVRLGTQSASTLIALAATASVLSVFLAIRMGAPHTLFFVAAICALLPPWVRDRLNAARLPPHRWTAGMGVTIFVATMAASATVYALAL